MKTSFFDLPRTEAGAKMPTSASIVTQDRARLLDAQYGSAELLRRIVAYQEREGRS